MHHLHNEILRNLENDRVAREAEVYFQNLRDAGIAPASTRRSFSSWLSGIRATRLEPRPHGRPSPAA